MLQGELERYTKRLEQRVKHDTEVAKRKAEKERILAERQFSRKVAQEQAAAQKRLQSLERAEEERIAHESELEQNNGVVWRNSLVAVPVPDSIVQNKGIKRAADKILLPPSAGRSLMDQNAYSNGPMFFKLQGSSGSTNVTHAGLLEFSAAEGFVALPQKVIHSLLGPDMALMNESLRLEVSYRRLPKGEKAVFQPRAATFQTDVVDMKDLLETALSKHSVLTEGDWLDIHLPGGVVEGVHQLRVVETTPRGAISIIDTDLEAEILPSIETEDKIKEEEEKLAAIRAAIAAEAAQRQEEEVAALQKAEVEAAQRRQRASEAALRLPSEPSSSNEGVVDVLIRLPDGSRAKRRFRLTDPLSAVFDLAESGYGIKGYQLVQQYPRKVFDYPENAITTLKDAGLTSKREMLFLETRAQNTV